MYVNRSHSTCNTHSGAPFERIEKMVLTMLICLKLCYCLVALDIILFEI